MVADSLFLFTRVMKMEHSTKKNLLLFCANDFFSYFCGVKMCLWVR